MYEHHCNPSLRDRASKRRLASLSRPHTFAGLSIWLLVSEPGFSGFWRQIPLKHICYIKKTCREWSEQLDTLDMDHFGFGIL